MNGQLEHGRAVTALRRTTTVRNSLGLADGVAEEDVVLSFKNTLADDVVVRLVLRKDEGDDTVAAVSGTQCVSVDTCFIVRVTLELIACTFTHRVTDGVEYLVEDVDLDTVEALLAVDGRIVTIETCRVEEFLLFLYVGVVFFQRTTPLCCGIEVRKF